MYRDIGKGENPVEEMKKQWSKNGRELHKYNLTESKITAIRRGRKMWRWVVLTSIDYYRRKKNGELDYEDIGDYGKI